MKEKILSPTYPESVEEGVIANWKKLEGEMIIQDEVLAEIETDKVVIEVVAANDGVMTKIFKAEGEVVNSGEVIGEYEVGERELIKEKKSKKDETPKIENNEPLISNSVNKFAKDNEIDLSLIKGTGKSGRIIKQDLINYISNNERITKEEVVRETKRVPMSRLRKTVAERLVNVQRETAMLTTFNEVDMTEIMKIREQKGEDFFKKNQIKLGYMGFFVSAAVSALNEYPQVNASIDGEEIVFHGFKDIGVAVSTDRGLTVPIIKDADLLRISDIEKLTLKYSEKARKGKLTIEEMQGGTFTISNGGVFGSLLSTPILNAPQTAILGMHKIQDRPIAVEGKIEIRPMMYLALSYDHRIIDGKEAVSFLVHIKNEIENPANLYKE
ncbi:MAG: 2-oxoglutarate dehydrogenase complex dihydrolipoyllysine-residue succinyltransferase [Hyphomicrobiales bacterium]|nr:2-oxoglutarate dehydrogenase complex dihydrolipoyllysine-residue succinyltransferase [Hyphomicrobiales bacterium]